MPSTPISLQYSRVVNVDLSDNAINFADAELDGHRVQVRMAIDDLNSYFIWTRSVGADRPYGYVTNIPEFEKCLEVSFNDGFIDFDSMTNGLCYIVAQEMALVQMSFIRNAMVIRIL